MTRKDVKDILPIIQAYAEGKTIQFRAHINDEWRDIKELPLNGFTGEYCIKQESKYRPFETKEECLQEMQKHQPFGWIKSKKDGSSCYIEEISWLEKFREVVITYSTKESLLRDSKYIFNTYTFADDMPFGIKE